jgi:hypothetical protein
MQPCSNGVADMKTWPQICLFCGCEKVSKSLNTRAKPSEPERTGRGLKPAPQPELIMEETAQKSCWGITARAVIGFSGLLALAYLFGGI